MNYSTIYASLEKPKEIVELIPLKQEMVVFGRQFTSVTHPTLESRLMWQTMPFFYKMTLKMGQVLDIDPRQIERSLPPSVRKLFSMLENSDLFQSIEKKQSLVLRQQFNHLFQQLIEDKRQLLLLAGVSSQEEFRQKLDTITTYKKEARTLYLRNADNIENRKKIDKALIELSKQKIGQEQIIDQYWDLVAQNPEYEEEMQQLENRALQLFSDYSMESILSLFETVQNGLNRRKEVDYNQLFIQALNTSINKVEQQLRKEQMDFDEKGQIKMNYLLLKGSIIMPTILNEILRKVGNEQIKKAKQRVSDHLSFVKKNHEGNIDYYQQCIKNNETLLQLSKLNFTFSDEDRELNKKWREEIVEWKKQLELEENKTEDELLAEAYAYVETTTSELKKSLPKKDRNENKIRHLLGMDLKMEELSKSQSMIAIPNDIQIDLSKIQDPVSYFLEQMQLEDQHKLDFAE